MTHRTARYSITIPGPLSTADRLIIPDSNDGALPIDQQLQLVRRPRRHGATVENDGNTNRLPGVRQYRHRSHSAGRSRSHERHRSHPR